MVMIIITITMITITISTAIITKIIKCRDIYRTPITTNMKLLVTLHNHRMPLCNNKKSSPKML